MEDNTIKSFRHCGVVVKDLKKSHDFYKNILKLEVWRSSIEGGEYINNLVGLKNVKLEWVKFKTPDNQLFELLQYHSPVDSNEGPYRVFEKCNIKELPPNRIGCSHVAFTVKNIDEIYKKVTKGGFCAIFKPQINPESTVRVFYGCEPGGTVIEFVEELS